MTAITMTLRGTRAKHESTLFQTIYSKSGVFFIWRFRKYHIALRMLTKRTGSTIIIKG